MLVNEIQNKAKESLNRAKKRERNKGKKKEMGKTEQEKIENVTKIVPSH